MGAEPRSRRARIEPVRELDDEQRELLAKTLATPDGEPLALFRTLARHPRLLRRFNALGGLFLAHGSLPPRERELAILRVAWRSGCVYEFGQHTLLGRAAGLTEEEISRVAAGDPTRWADADRELLGRRPRRAGRRRDPEPARRHRRRRPRSRPGRARARAPGR